jgi:hypothetical protein
MTLQPHLISRLALAAGLALGLANGIASAQQADNDRADIQPIENAGDEVVVRELGELFGPSDLQPVAPNEVASVTTRTIKLDSQMLRSVNVGDRLSITPEPGLTERWLVADVQRRANGMVVVRMSQPMNPSAMATFVMVEDATAMTMQIAAQKRLYRLQFAGNDNYHVWSMNQSALPREGDAMHPDHLPPDLEPTPDDDDYIPPFGGRDAGGCNNANPVHDVWILYTVAARDGLGGTTATRAECSLAVEHANTAYIATGLSQRMRLIAATETSYDDSTTDQDTDLDRLTGTADGFIDSIHATRDTYNADVVHMVTDNGSGLGWCGGTTTPANTCFSVSRFSRVAASFTLAHEVGHNLGCGHDHANAGSCSSTTYAYGHRFTGTDSNGYCTVLAYPTDFYERVLHFSDPDVNFMGTPTGVAGTGPTAADNARVLASSDTVVEDHELTRYDIYVDFAYGGIEIGTAPLPYNTFAEGVTFIDTPNTGAGEVPTMYIDAGQQNYTGTITKAMTLVRCGGNVTIGTP